MKVSVVIPVFNVARFLPACLDSLLAQTFADWTCLLVDDGSTDGSAEICLRYAARDPRMVVRHATNGGAYAARAVGLAAAEDEAVYFCDADDILHPELLATLVSALESTAADFAYVDADECAVCRLAYTSSSYSKDSCNLPEGPLPLWLPRQPAQS